ncbi:uncharacterized protein LOC128270652 [Anopheles cruzii]|uniref:uncharacterized protein LOC128270652 n=1 Tax=Anopheles cruzii TaxID=68878 RepID=UPI0022EC7472|nr:uncharacterized protein LOC128270652 [Anopheles cruzii]
MDHLEGNISAYGLFVISRNAAQVVKVFEKIKSGDPQMRQYLQLSQMPHECAIAFRRFLRSWKIQFLPLRCINVLGGNITNVPPRLVALDVLNLLPEEYSGTRLYFAKRYLRLMRCFILRGCPRPNEMHAVTIPILAYMFSFPQRHHHTLATSLTIFELIILSELLNDTVALAKELRSSCIAFRRSSSDGTG